MQISFIDLHFCQKLDTVSVPSTVSKFDLGIGLMNINDTLALVLHWSKKEFIKHSAALEITLLAI